MTLLPVPLSAAAIKEAGETLERFGGIAGFIESILDVPSGYLKHWSQQNLIRWYDKLQAENAHRKAEGRQTIPTSLLMPALQKIAVEDNDDMLTMWARLFANFQDPDRLLEPNKIYVHLLSEMQPLDAKLLLHVANQLPEKQRTVVGGTDTPVGILFVTSDELANDMWTPNQDIILAVYNLSRLGCLLARPTDNANYLVADGPQPPLPQNPSIITDDGTFYLNSLGRMLIDACAGAVGTP